MGVRGRRNRNFIDEPSVLNDVKKIIEEAKQNGHINNYEVDIKKIVRERPDVQFIEDENLPSTISGYLKFLNGHWVIGVNKKHHPKRQRFTIAHEFAHFCLHKDDRGDFYDEEIYFRKNNDSSIEFKADEFAAELLMPEELFKQAVEKDGIKKISELAEVFNVSTLAIKHRAKELKYKTSKND